MLGALGERFAKYGVLDYGISLQRCLDLPNVDAISAAQADDLCPRRSFDVGIDLTIRKQILMARVLREERKLEL